MKRRFEFVKGTSSKFWEIEVKGKTQVVTFGRLGAKGQVTEKSFESPAAAEAAAVKLIAEKTKKGYRESGAGSPPARAAPEPKSPGAARVARKSPGGRKRKASPELIEAAHAGEERKVAKLLAGGADPDSRSENGATALMWAARNGLPQMAKALLEAGGDPNLTMTTEKKGTALGIAAKRGHLSVVELLLEGGANPKLLGPEVFERTSDLKILRLLGGAGAGDAKLSQAFRDRLGFLCETPHEKELLEALAWRVTGLKPAGGGLQIKFGKEVVDCAPPFKGRAAKWVPKSYAAIAANFNGVSWKSIGGGGLGYGGLAKTGEPSADWGWDSEYLSESSNKAFFKALKKAKTSAGSLTPAFGCAQNWLLFDPTRRNARGEAALGFVSHESCVWEPVKSADKLSYGGVLLRLLARYFGGPDELDEVST